MNQIAIPVETLLPGDVILCRGPDLISELICWLDGGTYSHATIYAGNSYIYEADFNGVVHNPVTKIRDQEKFGDVFRFQKNGHHLEEPYWPVQPVMAVGQHYVDLGTKYAFDHLILLGLLVVTRRIPIPTRDQVILRHFLDAAAARIMELIDHGSTLEATALQKSAITFIEIWNRSRQTEAVLVETRQVEPACISPRDLATSPDLQYLGRLTFGDKK